MFNRKFLAVILSVLCLTGCSGSNDVQQTSVSETTTAEIVTTTEITAEESIVEGTAETTEAAEYNWHNPEDGLVFFIQPSICQRDETSRVDDWECRDTDVLRDFHYDGEWLYAKELIFVFSNYTDDPVTIDSIQIIRESDGTPASFADGSDILNIDFTVQSMHKTDYLLETENFDYSACESGIYTAVVNIGSESYERDFFINNCGVYSETHISENNIFYDEETGEFLHREYTVYAPDFLTEEQQKIFAKAHGTMWDSFWCGHQIPEEYVNTHTTEDFMAMLYGIFTEDYANKLAPSYIDENGQFIIYDADRGANINYFDHCFFPISADENRVEFKAVVTYCHSDNPYEVAFNDECRYVMVSTENGWRVDRFDLWN